MIYLIITTSILNKAGIKDSINRQNRYIDCINTTLTLLKNEHDIKVIVVENNGLRKTYLDDLKCDVMYTNNNILNFKHKGVNELFDIKEVIKKYEIKDDDYVVKLTGRYKMLNLEFINLIKNNILKYDAFVKFFNVCTLEYLYVGIWGSNH